MDRSTRRTVSLGLGTTLREAVVTIIANPLSSGFNAVGMALGAATAITAIGLSATSQSQVDSVFDAYAQTQVTVYADDAAGSRLPPSEAVLETLPGVVAATTIARLEEFAHPGLSQDSGNSASSVNATVFSIGPSAVEALELGDWIGRPIDIGFHERGDAVAVIGAGVARDLGISPPYGDTTVQIAGNELTVIGVFASSPRERLLTQSVLVPRTWSDHHSLDVATQKLIIRVDVGAADVIAERAPGIVNPFEPERVQAAAPPTAESLRAQVATRVGALVFMMAAGALLVGAIGISNTALVGVLRRTREFSIRRALGATPRDVALLVIIEGAILGLLSGLLGGVTGMLVVIGVSWVAGWTPLLEVGWVGLVSVGVGVLGALFSVYPARRASRLEPAIGLRQL